MPTPSLPTHCLIVVPGTVLVLFVVCMDRVVSLLSVRVTRFLEDLHAADGLASFAELHREDDVLDELLPWAGNV
jgi:hypothetical protein